MTIAWVVDELLTERFAHSGFPTLAAAARAQGHAVYQTKYVPFSKEPDPAIPFTEGCVVAYGTHEFVSQVKRKFAGRWRPGCYHRIENLSYSAYSPHLGDILLNDDFVLVPYAEVMRRGPHAWGGGPFFLKPDAVTKAFTGQVIRNEQDLSSIAQIERVAGDTLCVVAKPKLIKGEFRFVIVDRGDGSEPQVVTGSEYRWDGRLDIRSDVHPLCLDMATEVARRDWQADTVYVCDVALTENDGKDAARVVELNTFSCAGLYACDTRKIVEAVSAAAWSEFA